MVAVGGTFPPLLDGVSLQCFVCLWLLVSGYGYRFNKSKRFHSTLFVAFLLLCIGVVIFNFKLFYMQFAVGEDLNRNHFIIEPINIAIGLYHYFVEGFYHASTIQKYVVFPVCFITCCYVAWQWIRNKTVTKEQSVFLFVEPWRLFVHS